MTPGDLLRGCDEWLNESHRNNHQKNSHEQRNHIASFLNTQNLSPRVFAPDCGSDESTT